MKKKIGMVAMTIIAVAVVFLVLISGGMVDEFRKSEQINEGAKQKSERDFRPMAYKERWLEKGNISQSSDEKSVEIVITEVYSNCFMAECLNYEVYKLKANGELGDAWCVGDQALVSLDNVYMDKEDKKMEGDLLRIEKGSYESGKYEKPVLYLYPETTMEVRVELELKGNLTCTYPRYQDGWKVTAMPGGTLKDAMGQTYNYLYWEGDAETSWDMSRGFCVKGEDTAEFLEDALKNLGLTREEANEFIVYWLPVMQEHPYNIISFQGDAYTEVAKLNIEPKPDTIIRVFMTWQAVDTYVELEPQELTAPKRNGFTVVEWGGTEIEDA